jgi:hypothetical protein
MHKSGQTSDYTAKVLKDHNIYWNSQIKSRIRLTSQPFSFSELIITGRMVFVYDFKLKSSLVWLHQVKMLSIFNVMKFTNEESLQVILC